MTNLEEKITKYAELQKQLDSLNSELSELRSEIISDMQDRNLTDFKTENGQEAKLVSKQLFKYVDELSIIKYLKENNLTQFLSEKINTSLMNKELKKETALTESLNSFYEKTDSVSLTVKED